MKAYLSVKVSKGMLSDENSVWIEDYTGTATFGFFEKRHIKDGKLEVGVLEEKDNLILIKLPGRTMESPGDKGYITVRKDDLEYELADNCYECVSFGNVRNAENGISEHPKVLNTIPKLFDIRDGKGDYGLCYRIADCTGTLFIVRKEQRCMPIFSRPDKKLSPEEIILRDKRESEEHKSLQEAFEHARKTIASWPKWKQEIVW